MSAIRSLTSMPDSAFTWIYASAKPLQEAEQTLIQSKVAQFYAGWTAHQIPVQASFDILHNQFLVIMVDVSDDQISGCGIDKSVAFIRDLGNELGIDFFNRMQIELKTDQGLLTGNKQQVTGWMQEGRINENTLTFDKTITRKRDFDLRFEIPVSAAWFYPSLRAATVKQN